MEKIAALEIKVSENDIKDINNDIKNILLSGINWTNSVYVSSVENKISEMLKIPFCAATSTGSSAIESVLISLDIENTCIFAPVLTAPATIYSCLNNKSDIVLVDTNTTDFSIDIDDLENKINKYYLNKYSKKGAIIVVHVGGIISKDIYKIKEIADKYNLYLIEDCAHAHGSYLDEKPAGSWGIAGTYSFFLTKTITSGEGGAVVSFRSAIIDKIKQIRNYGKSAEGLHIFKGSSWRMNEFTAAILFNRLKVYNKSIREMCANNYREFLSFDNFFYPLNLFKSQISGYYKFIVKIKAGCHFNYNHFQDFMKSRGVSLPARVFDRLICEEPFLKCDNTILNNSDNFANAKLLSNSHICLPIYESLEREQIKYICTCLKEYGNQILTED